MKKTGSSGKNEDDTRVVVLDDYRVGKPDFMEEEQRKLLTLARAVAHFFADWQEQGAKDDADYYVRMHDLSEGQAQTLRVYHTEFTGFSRGSKTDRALRAFIHDLEENVRNAAAGKQRQHLRVTSPEVKPQVYARHEQMNAQECQRFIELVGYVRGIELLRSMGDIR